MESAATNKDRWASEITPEIVERETEADYHVEFIFKDRVGGKRHFRTIGSPGSNEALAEAALLEACGKAGGPFARQPDVYSYRLATATEVSGSFSPYFDHYKRRQRAIGRCCRKHRNETVFYSDIRNFYPSLSRTRVRNLWKAACEEGGLDEKWSRLGLLLLDRQKSFAAKGVMVGPMFSHLLADLALRNFDKEMRKRYRNRYFRYVDDIALVLPAADIPDAKKRMARLLKVVGVRLHPKKYSTMPAAEWAKKAPWQGKASSFEKRDKKWIALIDRIKCYLLKRPSKSNLLGDELRAAGVRIPLPRYQAAITDADYQNRLKKRMNSAWFNQYIHGLTRKKVVAQSRRAVIGFLEEFSDYWEEYGEISVKMEQKWHAAKLKSILGKLTMLAPEDLVPSLTKLLDGHEEFASSCAILRAIETNDVSELIAMGGSVCGAAGQVLAVRECVYSCKPKRWPAEARQGFATLRLMGVQIRADLPVHVRRDFDVRFVIGDFSPKTWRRIKSRFARDMMAISREVSLKRNQHLMHAPLNPDDEWLLLSDELNSPVFSPS
jgi:hypothetical protein